MRTRTLFRGGLAAAVVTLLMSTVQSSEADEWYPGLPDASFGAWTNASQSGLSYAKRAKQWFRSPTGMTVAEVFYGNEPGEVGRNWVRGQGYFVSPKGAPANYGYLEPMTVRSVGFGIMPVEATIQVSQRRENGYPIPVDVLLRSELIRYPGSARLDRSYPESVIRDSLNVRVLSVRIDGVDLGLNGDCRTVEPAPVVMRSPAYVIEDAYRYGSNDTYIREWYLRQDPSTYYHPSRGGQFTGTMTIPPFTGCTTAAGDDLSELLTLSASGPDNPISARSGWPCAVEVNGAQSPMPPGASNPKLGTAAGGETRFEGQPTTGCAGTKPFEYPVRGER